MSYLISKETLGDILGKTVDYSGQVKSVGILAFSPTVDYEILRFNIIDKDMHENHSQNKGVSVDTLLRLIKNKFYEAGYSITTLGTKRVIRGEIYKGGRLISWWENLTEIEVMISLYEEILKKE